MHATEELTELKDAADRERDSHLVMIGEYSDKIEDMERQWEACQAEREKEEEERNQWEAANSDR